MALTNGKGFGPIFWIFLASSLLVLTACGGGKKKAKAQPPVASIVIDEARGLTPFNATFDGSSSSSPEGTLASYVWTFPDGSQEVGETASYTFVLPGTHTVSLMVKSSSGLSDTVSVTVDAVDPDETFSVQGVIRSLPFTDTDGDINDPNAPYFNNDGGTTDRVQSITNPIKLNGFAAKSPTRQRGDKFESSVDTNDHFRVRLNEKDFVSVLITNFKQADIDLFLYKEATMELVSYSTTSNAYDSVQVKESGDYIVVLEAVNGYSNYILQVGRNSYQTGLAALGKTTDFVEDQIIIRMEGDNSEPLDEWYPEKAQMKVSHRSARRAMLARINPLNPQTHNMLWGNVVEQGFGLRLSNINPGSSQKLKTIKAIKRLKQQEGVRYAEPNYRVQSLYRPNDSLFVWQWHLHNLNMRQAWDITTGNPNVVIAVIDTGVYLEHPDLKNQLVPGFDFVSNVDESNDGDGIDDDPNDPGDEDSFTFSSFHGTHVAGIAVGEVNNSRGIVGVAPHAKVMPVRAIGMDGGLMYDVLQAVRYAGGLENDSGTVPAKAADVINLSLGGPGYSQAPKELFEEVRDRGVIIVASSGNQNTGEAMYPASYPGVISVGAAELSGERAYYSNTGINVDVVAYGGNMDKDEDNDDRPDGILSTMVFGDSNGNPDPDYSYIDGTSMSAPQVSAIAALMKSVYSELTPELFDSLLYSGRLTIDKGDVGRDNEYGYGLIDGLKSVEAARDLNDGGVTSAITSDIATLFFDDLTTELSLNIEAVGNGSISITSITASEDWVNVGAEDAGADGLGRYTVDVSIASQGLSYGNYHAYVEFETDQGTKLRVELSALVGSLSDVGNAGYLYILLIDDESGGLVDTIAMSPTDGLYNYQFKEVPVGQYYVTAGSDIDNDDTICNYGESCGSYPRVDSFEVFSVLDHIDGINFDAGLYTSSDLLGRQVEVHKLFQ